AAMQAIVPEAAPQRIAAAVAEQRVISEVAVDEIVAVRAVDSVIAEADVDLLRGRRRREVVVSPAQIDPNAGHRSAPSLLNVETVIRPAPTTQRGTDRSLGNSLIQATHGGCSPGNRPRPYGPLSRLPAFAGYLGQLGDEAAHTGDPLLR